MSEKRKSEWLDESTGSRGTDHKRQKKLNQAGQRIQVAVGRQVVADSFSRPTPSAAIACLLDFTL